MFFSITTRISWRSTLNSTSHSTTAGPVAFRSPSPIRPNISADAYASIRAHSDLSTKYIKRVLFLFIEPKNKWSYLRLHTTYAIYVSVKEMISLISFPAPKIKCVGGYMVILIFAKKWKWNCARILPDFFICLRGSTIDVEMCFWFAPFRMFSRMLPKEVSTFASTNWTSSRFLPWKR